MLLLIVFIPGLLIEGLLLYTNYQARKADELHANLEVARVASSVFEAFFQDVLHQELAIGTALTLSPLPVDKMNHLLKQVGREYELVQNLAWADADGRFIACNRPDLIGLDISDRPYFKEIHSGKEWAVSNLLKLHTTGVLGFVVARAIRDENNAMLGIVVASIQLDRLDRVLTFQRLKKGGFSIVDKSGMLVYRYGTKEMTWEERDWLRRYPSVIKEALRGKEVLSTIFDVSEGQMRMIARVPIPSIGWIVGAGHNEREAMKPIVLNMVRQAALLVVITLGGFLAAFIMSRSITAPIERLQRYALSIEAGKPDAAIEPAGPAEILDLTLALTSMVSKLENAKNELERQVKERTAELSQANARLRNEILDRQREQEERLRLERTLHEVQKAESLGCMAGAIAHHFNNILGVVMGNLELALYDIPQSSSIGTLVNEAMKASRKASEISLLMLSYLGQTVRVTEPLNLSAIGMEMLPLLKASLPGHIGLNTDFGSPEPVISGDAVQVKQVLTNLFANAVEAIGDREGDITLTIDSIPDAQIHGLKFLPPDWMPQAKTYACLSVADTGCGLDPGTLEKIFDPFFSTKFIGRGLGLPVVLGIARAHGGAVNVESRVGQVTIFRVYFPLAENPADRLPAAGRPCLSGEPPKQRDPELATIAAKKS